MVFISELQKDTVFLLDDLINENRTHEEIVKILLYKFYWFR